MAAHVIKPTFHHVNLKTTRLQEIVDYATYLPPKGRRDRARVLPRPRYGALVLLRRSRRQPRRVADGRLRRLGVVEGMDEHSKEFKADPVGRLVDPAAIAADQTAGLPFEDIHAKAMRGGYAPPHNPRRGLQAVP
jgi:hypothetical protein